MCVWFSGLGGRMGWVVWWIGLVGGWLGGLRGWVFWWGGWVGWFG